MICATPFSHSGYPLGDMRSGLDYTLRPKSFGYYSEGVLENYSPRRNLFRRGQKVQLVFGQRLQHGRKSCGMIRFSLLECPLFIPFS